MTLRSVAPTMPGFRVGDRVRYRASPNLAGTVVRVNTRAWDTTLCIDARGLHVRFDGAGDAWNNVLERDMEHAP